MSAFFSDQYRQNRGGWSRMLKISCQSCNSLLFHYQKDGPGPLKRSYVDRIIGKNSLVAQKDYVFCPHCKVCLGFTGQYEKEGDRPAIFWLVGAVDYRIVPVSKSVQPKISLPKSFETEAPSSHQSQLL